MTLASKALHILQAYQELLEIQALMDSQGRRDLKVTEGWMGSLGRHRGQESLD